MAPIQPPAQTHDVVHTTQPEQGDLLAATRARNATPAPAPTLAPTPAHRTEGDDATAP
jgi:hypothetical protein